MSFVLVHTRTQTPTFARANTHARTQNKRWTMRTNLCYRICVISVADGIAITAGSVPIAAGTDGIAANTDSPDAAATASASTASTASTAAQQTTRLLWAINDVVALAMRTSQ